MNKKNLTEKEIKEIEKLAIKKHGAIDMFHIHHSFDSLQDYAKNYIENEGVVANLFIMLTHNLHAFNSAKKEFYKKKKCDELEFLRRINCLSYEDICKIFKDRSQNEREHFKGKYLDSFENHDSSSYGNFRFIFQLDEYNSKVVFDYIYNKWE